MAPDHETPPARPTRCIDCGYTLDHLPENRCPECGRKFDPANPDSVIPPWVQSTWVREAQPPPAWNLVIVAALALMVGITASEPQGSTPLAMCYLPVFALFLPFDYLVRIVAIVRLRSASGLAGPRTSRRRWRWAAFPMLIVFWVTTVQTGWARQAHFSLSQTAFDQVVRGLEAGTHTNTGRQWIGLYRVKRITN